MTRIHDIVEQVRSYAPKADIDLIERAFVFASLAHADQKRRSGESYFMHPLAVAGILASLRLDEASIVTGLLHDTVEDTHVTLDDIRRHFGNEVAALVDGVTKIGQLQFRSSEHKQAENFRKMILATARDMRVLLVKLADRLHNMRTLEHLREEKRRAISEETMQLYAPLAHRLGIHWIKQEMEDLSFSHLEPQAWNQLAERVGRRRDFLIQTKERLERVLQEVLRRKGVHADVQGRLKHLYSIHDKMQRKHVDFDDIYDLVAFRIIVADISECYQTLGIIHSLYRPVPGRFKDYIALPKPNGYQSLHTTVIGPENYRIEVQLRTSAMHSFAEDGVAAHWVYKSQAEPGEGKGDLRWLKQLTELLHEAENPGEFLESVRLDLFVQEVYVFSRDGDIFALPRGSTPLDFAYAVHTDVGNHCVGVRVNGEPADFRVHLCNGDEIEVLTSPTQSPSRQWLQYVKSSRARQSIRQWFRRLERDSSLSLGEQILRESTGLDAIPKTALKRLNCRDMNELKEKLGRGDLPIDRLLTECASVMSGPLHLRSHAHMAMHPAKCCHPIPGDAVLGHFKSGQGLMIHHVDCAELAGQRREHWLDVEWQPEAGKLFSTAIEIRSQNRPGMLARVSAAIADAAANIQDLRIRQLSGSISTLTVLLDVADRKHLAQVLRNLRLVDGVVQVKRNINAHLTAPKIVKGLGERLRDMVLRGFSKSPKASKEIDDKE